MKNIEANIDLLCRAAKQGNLDDVQRLIPISDPKALHSWALRVAARNGHTQCVELLIPVSEPKAIDSEALRAAAINGHTQCVKLLNQVSEPKALDSEALRSAVFEGHQQCIELLYPVSDPLVALKRLQEDFPDDYTKWGQLQQRIEAERLSTVLHTEIGDTTTPKVQRKM